MIHYTIKEHKEYQLDGTILIKYAIYEDEIFCYEYDNKEEAIKDYERIMNYE